MVETKENQPLPDNTKILDNEIFLKVLGARLRQARQTNGWTQSDLAIRAGVTTASISHYEQGKKAMSLRLFVELCLILGCGFDYFFVFNNEELARYCIETAIKARLSKFSTNELVALSEVMKEGWKK